MSSLLTRMRNDSGQALVFVVFTVMVLVGMAALVIDGGSWYQADRRLQTAADAAALAGAQQLPTKQSEARTVALDYAQKNYAGIPEPAVEFPDAGTINVSATAKAPGIFARIFDIDEVTVHAEAQAQITTPLEMKNIAPIAVQDTAACFMSDPECFNQTVTVDFQNSHIGPSMHGLINVECWSDTSSNCGSGQAGGDELKEWIEDGYPKPLPSSKWYGTKTGNTLGPVSHGLEDAANLNKTLFFPVWDEASASDGTFHIIGWAAFVIDPGGVTWKPEAKTLTGHFVTFITSDLPAGGPIDPDNDFGVRVITLTK